MINWGIAAPRQNALANIGPNMAFGFQAARQVQAENRAEEGRNALAAYATNPTQEGIAGIAQYAPEFALQEQGRYQQQAQAQQQSGMEGVAQFRPMLEQAMQSPEAWQQVRTAAAQGGHDVSAVPEQFDPEWARGQLLILAAADEGMDLTETARNVMLSLPPDQRNIENPAFITGMGRALERQISLEPGGRVVGVNTVTGNAREIASPGYGPPSGAQPELPPIPEGFELEGGTAGNGGGGF